MPLWDKDGTKPKWLTPAEKRNVIATDAGWVRRITYKDVEGDNRVKDEILVAIQELASANSAAVPAIDDFYFDPTTITEGQDASVFVVFNEAIQFEANSPNATIQLSNEGANTSITLTCVADNDLIVNATNTLVFTGEVENAGEYIIAAQTIGGSPVLVSQNDGSEEADLDITSDVADAGPTLVVTA